MIKVELQPFEVQLAFENSTKRYIENLKQGKTFSYGYFGGFEKTITDGILGSLGEVAFAKGLNRFYNGSYSDSYARYTDSDFQDHIEIRSQKRKPNNFLLIRPNEKHGKYVLVIHEGDFKFSIVGWYPFYKPLDDKLTDFGYSTRPPAYRVDIEELKDIKDL
jgi:hypothetical protein|tara:strand:- start:7519 stop:8004 length:486 start_codon:yes stop_codon:yes gene_type:complete